MTDHAQTWHSSTRCLALMAHCDDIEIHMGGTFARMIREGKRATYVVSVENAYMGAHIAKKPSAREMLAFRREESRRGAAVLGASRLEFLAMKSYYLSREDGSVVYPSLNSLENVQTELADVVFDGLPPVLNAYMIPTCRDRIRNLILEERPQLIITQSPDDRHPDHYCLARTVTLIVESLIREGHQMALWYSEPGTGGPMSEYWPDVYVELSAEDVQRRVDASACFASQFPTTMEEFTRQRCRAYGRVVGVENAEAFRAGIWPQMREGDGEIFRRLEQGPPRPQIVGTHLPRTETW